MEIYKTERNRYDCEPTLRICPTLLPTVDGMRSKMMCHSHGAVMLLLCELVALFRIVCFDHQLREKETYDMKDEKQIFSLAVDSIDCTVEKSKQWLPVAFEVLFNNLFLRQFDYTIVQAVF